MTADAAFQTAQRTDIAEERRRMVRSRRYLLAALASPSDDWAAASAFIGACVDQLEIANRRMIAQDVSLAVQLRETLPAACEDDHAFLDELEARLEARERELVDLREAATRLEAAGAEGLVAFAAAVDVFLNAPTQISSRPMHSLPPLLELHGPADAWSKAQAATERCGSEREAFERIEQVMLPGLEAALADIERREGSRRPRPANAIPDYVAAAVASERRLGADRRRDERRKPAEVLSFFGIVPGARVAELMSGTGYHAGLLCEIVGPTGMVYAHNTPGAIARRNGNPLRTRITKCALENIEIPVAPCDAAELPEALDAVLICNTYHDAVWTGVDRAAMNGGIFAALKPGGILGIVDHHAPAGSGFDQAKALHRVEKQAVIAEVEASGFSFEAETGVLENPDDPLDINIHGEAIEGKTSRYVLRFRKAAA